jgi:hypothetical protein
VENNGCYGELSETLRVSLADDAQTLCLSFHKGFIHSKVVKIIYIHSV